MVVECTGRNVEITPKLRALTDQRAARLERRLGGPADVRVILNHEKHRFRRRGDRDPRPRTMGRQRGEGRPAGRPGAGLRKDRGPGDQRIRKTAGPQARCRRRCGLRAAKEPRRSPAAGGNGDGRASSVGRRCRGARCADRARRSQGRLGQTDDGRRGGDAHRRLARGFRRLPGLGIREDLRPLQKARRGLRIDRAGMVRPPHAVARNVRRRVHA